MFNVLFVLKRLKVKLKSGTLKTAIVAAGVVLYGTVSEYYIENGIPSSGIHSLFRSLWWTMQTVTTVGYGDTKIVGAAGMLNAYVVMLAGIGSLGFFLASITANMMDFRLASKLGEVRIKMKNHVIICNVDERIRDIVKEITENGMDVIILSTEDPKLEGLPYSFVKGSPTEEGDLVKAGLLTSSKIVVLAQKGGGDELAVDAKSIFATMVIRKKKPDSYIITELMDSENYDHAKMAGADEIIVKGSMSSLMIYNSVFAPGVAKLFSKLLTGDDGYRIQELVVDRKYFNGTCETFYRENEKGGSVVLAFRKGDEIKIRPLPSDLVIWDSVIVMEPRNR